MLDYGDSVPRSIDEGRPVVGMPVPIAESASIWAGGFVPATAAHVTGSFGELALRSNSSMIMRINIRPRRVGRERESNLA